MGGHGEMRESGQGTVSTKWVSGVLLDDSDTQSEDGMSRSGADSPLLRSAYFYSEYQSVLRHGHVARFSPAAHCLKVHRGQRGL